MSKLYLKAAFSPPHRNRKVEMFRSSVHVHDALYKNRSLSFTAGLFLEECDTEEIQMEYRIQTGNERDLSGVGLNHFSKTTNWNVQHWPQSTETTAHNIDFIIVFPVTICTIFTVNSMQTVLFYITHRSYKYYFVCNIDFNAVIVCKGCNIYHNANGSLGFTFSSHKGT